MKKQIALLMLAAGLVTGAQAETLRGVVIGVTDGDTVKVLTEDMQTVTVRVAGIDAPEKDQPFGSRSKWSLSACAYGRAAEIEGGKRDRYGRTVGKVIVSGADCGLRQIEAGMAWHYKAYQREQSVGDRQMYSIAEGDAREAGRGLWGQHAEAPWEWRKGRSQK
ncbi:thermonuclease family protein [Acidovorax lacteus]|uniref:Thermonuclease family protein n=1 Tax=Acidovorax lacteus TaxID=1924988 RepID=A0ABP8LC50_9BURK